MSGLERSLYKLNAVRELGEWANEFIDLDAEEDDGNDGNGVFIAQEKNESVVPTVTELSEKLTTMPNAESDNAVLSDDEEEEAVPTFFAKPCVTPVPNSSVGRKRQDSVIVIIRHGKTQVRNHEWLWLVADVGSFTKYTQFSHFSLSVSLL